jgi:2-oxoglutarate ferredoxin oxidoreductase subunit gamma
MSRIEESIINAGFGGQGVMVLGKFFATCGMLCGLEVTWLPSYGAEVRGGTAHSFVKISSDKIANPVVFTPDAAIFMNGPSLDKFEQSIRPGGLLILNSSMSTQGVKRNDIDVVKAPLTDEAISLGNVRIANIIAAGIYAAKKRIFEEPLMENVIGKMLAGREDLITVNIKALKKGMEIGRKSA